MSTSLLSTERRRRIVEAAARLFAAAPYADVRMDAIAASAAVAKPTLYRYFPTKEALFVAALERSLDDLGAALRSLREDSGPADRKLDRLVRLVLTRIERLAPAINAIEAHKAEWGSRSRRVLRKGFASLRSDIGEIVRDGVREGRFADVDPELASLVILGGIRMAAHAHSGRGGALAERMADLLLGGLRGAGSGSRALPSPAPTVAGALA